MFEREPIFHDRQTIVDQVPQTTSSTSFVDMTNAILTTKDLGQDANYTIIFSLIISASVAITTASFQILINGTPPSEMARTLGIKMNNADLGATFMGSIDGLTASDTIGVKWKTNKGTLTLSEFNFSIDGIPEIRVIK